jgi:hypothetical protein
VRGPERAGGYAQARETRRRADFPDWHAAQVRVILPHVNGILAVSEPVGVINRILRRVLHVFSAHFQRGITAGLRAGGPAVRVWNEGRR